MPLYGRLFTALQLIAAASQYDGHLASATAFAPNRFLGTCLTEEWVNEMELELGVSASDRDPVTKQLLHPFLHAALPGARYKLEDTRTANASAYSPACKPVSEAIYGTGAVVDPDTGLVTDIGHVAGSLVLEVNEGAVHRLNTMVFAIVAAELIGYNVSIYTASGSVDIVKRITFTDPQALCTPVHANVAVPTRVAFSLNSWLVLGDLGNRVIQGIYTSNDFIADGRDATKYTTPFYADFWRDYVTSDELIEAMPESNLRNNSQYYPPSTTYCKDGEYGCLDNCQRTYACTLREQQPQHNECLVIAATQATATRFYWPALINNLNIPAYTCFVGRKSLQKFVLEMYSQRKGMLFYLAYPDEFLARYPSRFQRVSMPKGTAADQAKNTATFGENGYGNRTDNPVRVDRFDDTNQKLVALNLLSETTNAPAVSVFSRIRIADDALENLLNRYILLTNGSTLGVASKDPYFDAACSWMRDNYSTWKGWMQTPLPLCTVEDHMTKTLSGCRNASSVREISFEWAVPDPTNKASPFVCDGGVMDLPPTLRTSRSCQWLDENSEIWYAWIQARPPCDGSFYSFEAKECGADSKRRIEYFWLLPAADNASRSHECVGELPQAFSIECEYMPVTSAGYLAVSTIVCMLMAVITVCMALVFRHRNLPIVRRSQFEFLEAMLLGTLCICVAILVYADKPTNALCGARPFVLSVGFALVFGSLVIKTLRVYRIFNNKRIKRVVLPTKTMAKLLLGFLLIDAIILATWFIADFPSATNVPNVVNPPSGPDLVVHSTVCSSSSFVFSALLIFWKAVLLGTGLFLSFQVRKVSSDFQESIYIFSSSVVVALACFMLMPLAFLVPLAASVFYTFFAVVLWASTLSVVALMLVPKLIRHRDVMSSASGTKTAEDSTSQPSNSSPDKGESGTGPMLSDHVSKSSLPPKHALRVVPLKTKDRKRGPVDGLLDTLEPSGPPASSPKSTY